MRKLFIVFIIIFLLATPVNAARGGNLQPLDLTNVSGGGQSTTIIEKQTWWLNGITPDPQHIVINPHTFGTWDINEHNNWVAGGYLNAGASTTGTYKHIFDFTPIYACNSGYCAYWSGNSNWYGANVSSVSSLLNVQVCFSPPNRCFTLGSVWNSSRRQYEYTFCGHAVYAGSYVTPTDSRPDDPNIIEIIGSNGGRGVPTYVTLTVTNPTNKQIKNIYGGFGLSSDIIAEAGCDGIYSEPNLQHSYPFTWRQS